MPDIEGIKSKAKRYLREVSDCITDDEFRNAIHYLGMARDEIVYLSDRAAEQAAQPQNAVDRAGTVSEKPSASNPPGN